MDVHCLLRTDEKEMSPVHSSIGKSASDPIQLSFVKHEQADVQSSPSPAASALHVPAANESELRKSPSAKKKSTFSKLLHPTKAKTS